MTVYSEPVYEEPKLEPKLSKYERVLLPLMDSPGQWGKIGEYKTSDSAYQAALNLKHARYKIPGESHEWEFQNEDESVFARYLSNGSAHPAKKTASKRTKKATQPKSKR